MINKILMNRVSSYKTPTTLETDKKLNLIYGLNGTGKTTFSNYLYDSSNSNYSECSIDGIDDKEVLVYNQKFVQDYFYEPDNLKGIFTLSKENSEALEAIRKAEQEIKTLKETKENYETEVRQYKDRLKELKNDAENSTWKIKTDFENGFFDFCIQRLKGKKSTLFNYLLETTKQQGKPEKSIRQLSAELEAIQGSTAQQYNLLPTINVELNEIEANKLLKKVIVGNENSSVADLIDKLGNSDWVKAGLNYISDEIGEKEKSCPFCQKQTINQTLVENIYNYFDEAYEKEITELKNLLDQYEYTINLLPPKETFESNPFINNRKEEFENRYNNFYQNLHNNKAKITEKLNSPSQSITLQDSTKLITELNQYLEKINKSITAHNEKINNKNESLENIKKQFWEIMRWDYDQTILMYKNEQQKIKYYIESLNNTIKELNNRISTQEKAKTEEQKRTVNIDEAIEHINAGLLELGIDEFWIQKQSDYLYKIVRKDHENDTFQTLSEGEKMIISFLYFRELCRGNESVSGSIKEKVIVIDDPISSLSHIFIFNIGQLIKNEFFYSGNYHQVFLLTHSLYFFYEMTDPKHENRKANQQLFRIIKNNEGSQFLKMRYEEIQNDYHSYWSIVKDEKQPPALIANCMRNIIEYFFNFIEKKDLNNVFQKDTLQQTKYQAFYRYVNRESHSLGQNLFDFKEFDYEVFKEAFELVFIESGYHEHYKKMIK
ncbi:hypothetical protein D7Z54_07345 [Salibacterium salarium]|uniref:Nuclease SbcCD subunit C n=1 Tax=Salibacterium salarium TaxID=284579 RepID=A0A428N617_9BACI|nr:AAA family ATPase [Salibacterium salarium]RSL33925.1 hypothetical protein D7Z54_07345 [Salibacterium salarium]